MTANGRDSLFYKECWFLTGPTASGKSEVGLELAERLNAEIVSLDSMALYRGMDIGTAKPGIDQRRRIPHHLIDVIEPDQEYSLAQYVAAAERAVADIRGRGRQALFVGGTPLYLKALLRGIFEGPAADWVLRQRLIAEAEGQPPGFLHQRLSAVDPESAARLHSNDQRRLIRALEVFEKTGLSISRWQQQFEVAHAAHECRVFALEWPRDTLLRRIDERVTAMFAAGLIDEVRRLLSLGKSLSRTASQAVGYREVISHLAGQIDLPAAIAAVQNSTHRFARRQRTWFRSLSECRTLPLTSPLDAAAVAAQCVALGSSPSSY